MNGPSHLDDEVDGDYRRTILHSAVYSGSKAVIDAVIAAVTRNLDPEEVCI